MNSHAKRNWTQYNQNLVNRGSLTFLFDEECLKSWVKQPEGKGKPSFSRTVIQLGWLLKTVYQLSLRALQGFVQSILKMLGTPLTSPNYTLFCKRAKEAKNSLPRLSHEQPMEIAIDSSGLKVTGEGEWKVKKHGVGKRRGWIKIHIGVDTHTQELTAIEVTDEKTADSNVLPNLVEYSAKSLQKVLADGAYDTSHCRKHLYRLGIQDCIPPRRTGKFREEKEMEERNVALAISSLIGGGAEGIALWKSASGYSKRSLVETAFSRLKRLFGERLHNKTFNNLSAEVFFRRYVLNRMTRTSNIK